MSLSSGYEIKMISFFIFFFMVFPAWPTADAAANKYEIPIAGLFTKDQMDQEIAFRVAIDRINMDRTILPKAKLIPIVEEIKPRDSFEAEKTVCNLTSRGVAAIFGPQDDITSGIVKSICGFLDIPHYESFWERRREKLSGGTVKMYPDSRLLSEGIGEIVKELQWKTFTILYEDDDSLNRLQGVLKHRDHGNIAIRQLDPDGDHRILLKSLQNSSEGHIILDCKPEKILDILRQAKEVKLLNDYTSYLFTHLDAYTVDLGEFDFTKEDLDMPNITAIRLINPENPNVQTAVRDWIEGGKRRGQILDVTAKSVKTETALVYDSVFHFAKAITTYAQNQIKRITAKPLNCYETEKVPEGYGLIQFIKSVPHDGMTGIMKFDRQHGRRNWFQLELVQFVINGFNVSGTWNPAQNPRFNLTVTAGDIDRDVSYKMENKLFKVVSRIDPPYLMKHDNLTEEHGNARFYGYSINLIDEISKILHFKYKFQITRDNKYGSLNKETGKWDGLIRDLLEREADFAICDLTITQEREKAVDFTMPFMTLGISILFTKGEKSEARLFSFFDPFSIDVWLFMVTAYLGVSILLFFLARMSPSEWENPHPCNQECEELESNFNLVNCLWFSLGSLMCQGCDILPKMSPFEWLLPHPHTTGAEEMEMNLTLNNSIWHNCGSIMQQGSDIAPQAVSTRMVAGMWWFFTLIMISSYTANLAAFLTSGSMGNPINNAEDLAKQTKIKYGTVFGASTYNFFKNSNYSTYQKMWATMESADPSVFTDINPRGVERVLKGKRTYAFLMESTSIEYQVNKNCQLKQIGGLLDSKGYGIAMPMNSPYRTQVSGAVLRLQEEGKLAAMKEKWWKEENEKEVECEEEEEASDGGASELGLANVGGVFVVLALGCVASAIMSVVEFLWNIRKIAVEEEISPKEAFVRELKFALNLKETKKPTKQKKSSSKSSHSSASSLHLDNFDREQNRLS